MKQLLILSGKGGTGKTTVASAFIVLSGTDAFADCDVDAPNLHLAIGQTSTPERTAFFGFQKARIDPAKCTACGLCERTCRFDAIRNGAVDPLICEGCAVCAEICPAHAIEMVDQTSGNLMLYRDKGRTFSTARLRTGSGASGKLVTAVKRQLIDNASGCSFAIIDGSPGIGCPVIASISGVDLVLVVTEPTVSGIHDMRRILETARKFGTPCSVCINKCDMNPHRVKEIEAGCAEDGVRIAGKIPFDETVPTAMNHGRNIISYPESPAANALTELWDTVKHQLDKGDST